MAAFISNASPAEILYDQLEYLLQLHGACLTQCEECKRLEEVRRALMRPFIQKNPPTRVKTASA